VKHRAIYLLATLALWLCAFCSSAAAQSATTPITVGAHPFDFSAETARGARLVVHAQRQVASDGCKVELEGVEVRAFRADGNTFDLYTGPSAQFRCGEKAIVFVRGVDVTPGVSGKGMSRRDPEHLPWAAIDVWNGFVSLRRKGRR